MNWLDMALIAILAVSIVASFAKGFTREAIGLVAAVAALLCGSWFYRMAGDVVRPWVGSREVANLCGFLLIVAAVIVLGWLVSLLASKMMKAVGLSWLDRLLGLAFGVARGGIVCVAVITAYVAVAPRADAKTPPPEVGRSPGAPDIIHTPNMMHMASSQEMLVGFAVE